MKRLTKFVTGAALVAGLGFVAYKNATNGTGSYSNSSYSLPSQAQPARKLTKEELIDKVLAYESTTQLDVKPVEVTLTPADQETLNVASASIQDYYTQLEGILQQNGKATINDYRRLLSISLRSEESKLANYILKHNPELNKWLSKQDKGNSRTLESFTDSLTEYFLGKGVHFDFIDYSGENGDIRCLESYIIKEKGKLRADVLGHKAEIDAIVLGDNLAPTCTLAGEDVEYTAVYNRGRKHIKIRPALSERLETYRQLALSPIGRPGSAQDIIERLTKVGLSYDGKVEATAQIREGLVKSIRLHEAAHPLFYILEPIGSEGVNDAYRNRNEGASYLLQVLSARNGLAQLELANWMRMADLPAYEKTVNDFLNFTIRTIGENREQYRPIEIKTESGMDIILQLDKLSVDQIRRLAATYFVEKFPKHLALLK